MSYRPKIYLASKLFRADGWQQFKMNFPEFDIISTWHESPVQQLTEGEASKSTCVAGWSLNRTQVLAADALLAYGFKNDALNGTMIEIGMAYGRGIPIYLVGDYPWGTWKHLGFVRHFSSLKLAIEAMRKDLNIDPT